MKDNNRIGIFDSGFGGLTIFKCIQNLLPEYDYLYLGDNARTPYGNRSHDTVYQFTKEGVDFLFQKGCRLILIACNTASARALRKIQQQWLTHKYKEYPQLRVLGVIRPTVENISLLTSTKEVALWATTGTVKSESFSIEIQKYAPEVKLVQTACPLLAPLIEEGELEGQGVEFFISKYWQNTMQMNLKNLDTLLLACTHYPLLLKTIRATVPNKLKIITQGELVSKSLQNYLKRHPEMESRLSRNRKVHFFTTDRCDYFDHLAEKFMGQSVSSELAEIDHHSKISDIY